MLAYKLTDANNRTRAGYNNSLLWGENVTHTVEGDNPELCSDSWIHFYTHPFLASLMNCKHANFKNPVLWECIASGKIIHDPLKSGCKQLTTVKIIPMPEYGTISKIAFALLITKQIYKYPKWNRWADNWLSDTDRSKDATATAAAAYAADYAAYAATAAAAAAAADYAAYAAAAAAAAADYAAAASKLDIPFLIKQALQIK
jgi:hypothetical protein